MSFLVDTLRLYCQARVLVLVHGPSQLQIVPKSRNPQINMEGSRVKKP